MDKNLLQTFWVLAEGSDDKRVTATSEIIAIIQMKQCESQKHCKELTYTVDRLIKGLASSRKWARLGFSTALAQVLRHFPLMKVSSVLDRVMEHLKITPSTSKSEKSNILLGRIMAYLAVIQSGIILKAESDDAVRTITEDILNIKEEKVPLNQISTEVLVNLISKVSDEEFKDQMWPLLEQQLTCGWDKCTSDILWLLLVVRKHHHKQLDNEFMTLHWRTKHIFNEKNYEALGRIIKDSTVAHPIVHPVCTELMQRAIRKQDHFIALWMHVLHDKVFPNGVNCVYLVFQLIPEALQLTSTPDQVYSVLTPGVVNFLAKNIASKQCALHSAAKQLNQNLIATCHMLAPTLQVAMVMSLMTSFGKHLYDSGMVTRATQPLLSSFSVDALKEIGNILMDNIRGKLLTRPENSEPSLKGTEIVTQQKWSVLTLSNLINQETVSADLGWCISVAEFLFSMAFFGVEKTETSKHKFRQPLNAEVREKMNSAFFKTLDRISKHLGKRLKGYHAYTNCLFDIVQCGESLVKDSSVAKNSEVLDDKAVESWQKIITVTNKIKKKLDKMTVGVNDQLAFQLLFLHHGLQLFTEPSSAMEVLSELHTCYEKASKKRRQSTIKQSDGEPDWVDVIIDMLLSLLSQQSHLVRTVVNTVFTMICPHLTRHSIQLILDIFKTSKEGDDDLLQFEEDEDEEESEEEMESDDTTDDSDVKESEEEEGERSDRDPVDEKLINSVRSALGSGAADSSDEESAEDLDDSAMFKLDNALSAAFKGMSKNKKQEADQKTLLKHYKMRCLDILEVIVSHCVSCAVLLDLIIPLLSVMEAGVRNAADKDLGDRANKVFTQLMHLKKLPSDPSLDRSELPQLVENLIEYSAKVTGVPMIQNTAAACAFVIKIISSVEKYTGPSPIKTRAMAATKKEKSAAKDVENLDQVLFIMEKALKDFCLRRDSQVNHYFFLTVLEREPKLFWPLAETIFEQTISDSVRIFCRTQTTAMLTVLISKSSIQVLEPSIWLEFASRITTKVFQLIESATKQVLKPRYLHELLVLLHKVFTVVDKSALQHLVNDDKLNVINQLRGSVSSDTRHVINKICGYCNNRRHTKKKKKEKLPGIIEEKAKIPTDLQNGLSEEMEHTNGQMPSDDAKDSYSQSSETGKENTVKEKHRSKVGKKRRKSEIPIGSEPDLEVVKERKKKRKSLGIAL